MEGPPLGPGGGDITWPDQVAPRGRKASSTRKIKPQTPNLIHLCGVGEVAGDGDLGGFVLAGGGVGDGVMGHPFVLGGVFRRV